MYQNIKGLLQDDGVYFAMLLLIIAITSFWLGRQSVQQAALVDTPTVTITQPAAVLESAKPALATENNFVASKNGTKYHLISCPGAKQISEKNKIYFTSVDEAKSAGYGPAANCPGL